MKLLIDIDAEGEECGKCEFEENGAYWPGMPKGRRCNLFGHGKDTGKRCRACHQAEQAAKETGK